MLARTAFPSHRWCAPFSTVASATVCSCLAGTCKIGLDRRIKAAGHQLPAWRLHDLRRTFRTGLGALGVAPHVAELAINHARKNIEATYDKYRYEGEIKTALTLWSNRVLCAVEGRERKVVPLRGA